jgi:hypothetical protein
LAADRALDGWEPIALNEIVFRRILKKQYKLDGDDLSPKGFDPSPRDTTGISLCRADYLQDPKPESAAALGKEGMEFWVVEFKAEDLISVGLSIQPEPTESFLGHACSPSLTTANRETLISKGLIERVSKLPRTVHGPFFGKTPMLPR